MFPGSDEFGPHDAGLCAAVPRRLLLGGLPVMLLVSGCGQSATERPHQRFFAAVKKDPMFTWRPAWVTSDSYQELTGNRPFVTDVGATLTRTVVAQPVPVDGWPEAIAAAIGFGWVRKDSQVLRRDLLDSQGTVPTELNLSPSDDRSYITFTFILLAS